MILYIGNKLSKHGESPTSVDILGTLLSENLNVTTVSDKENKIIRLLDMIFSILNNRKKISFVLIDTYSTTNFLFALVCGFTAKCCKLQYVPLLHGGNLPKLLLKQPFLTKWLFSNSYKNVAPSLYIKESFENHGIETLYIPNNIEISSYKYIYRNQIKPKLLYVRALGAIYNPQLAVYVLNDILADFPDAELCMVGPDRDGSLSELQKLANKLNLSQKVTFTGSLSKKQWHKLSEDYGVFINTTNVDNMPVSVIEAMALGLPVVSTNVGGLPFLLSNEINALLVDPNDVSQMANAIKELLKKPNLTSKLSMNGRIKAESFDWKLIQNKWYNFLKSSKT